MDLIINFLFSEWGKRLIIALSLVLCLFGIYHKGVNDGKNHQKSLYEQEYNQKLNESLKQREVKQEVANKQGVEAAKQEQKVITVFKDRVQTEIEYVETHPTPKECNKMPPEEIVEYKKLMEEVR